MLSLYLVSYYVGLLLRSSDSLAQFKRHVKTYLFVKDYAPQPSPAPTDSCF